MIQNAIQLNLVKAKERVVKQVHRVQEDSESNCDNSMGKKSEAAELSRVTEEYFSDDESSSFVNKYDDD